MSDHSRTASKVYAVAGLFAGIGGIELGLHGSKAASYRTTLLCEIDPVARAVLSERFPEARLHPDVTTLEDVGDVDVLTAGFPCQDLSQAGQTQGMNGKKSSLVSHVFRLLERRRTPWVLLENVSFMLQLAQGHALEYVVERFERLGYRWAYRVMDSRAFGVPQRRERVYFVATLDEDPRKVLFNGNAEPGDADDFSGKACGFYWTEGNRGLGWAVDSVPTLKGGSTVGIPSPPAIWMPDGGIVVPDIRDAERLQGFPADWTAPAEIVGRRSLRWKLVGNAVTVNAAQWIGDRIALLDGDSDIEGSPVRPGKWPTAAWNVDGQRMQASLSKWPQRPAVPSLKSFLKFETAPLSERATAGFLSRFKVSQLRKPPGFIDALEQHLEQMRTSNGHHENGDVPKALEAAPSTMPNVLEEESAELMERVRRA